MNRQPMQKPDRGSKLRFESLEHRIVLDSGSLIWTDTSQMTLSFAPDGTDIGGASNVMHKMFEDQYREQAWQNAILRGFQAWAQPTSANIGLVTEQLQPIEPVSIAAAPADAQDPEQDADVLPSRVGYPFGTQGPRTEDPRFGDIRIGAVPLSHDVYAVAVSYDTITSGTWSGDVIFNSTKEYQDIQDLYLVALHEAGHVFGLADNHDDTSVMNNHGIPIVKTPSDRDIAEAQSRHGIRVPDIYELPPRIGNGTIDHATLISIPETDSFTRGGIPAIVYADLHDGNDVDVFRLPTFQEYKGKVEIGIQTSGISLLAPEVTVFSNQGADGDILRQSFNGLRGTSITLSIDEYTPELNYYVEVKAGRLPRDPFSVGTYSLTVSYKGRLVVDAIAIDSVLAERVRGLTQDELQKQFAQDRNIRVEEGVDGPLASADVLAEKPGFEAFDYYEGVGSIGSRNELDFYRVLTPSISSDSSVFMQSNVHSLLRGKLIPELQIVDINRNVISSEILVNGNGEFVIQTKLEQAQDYFLLVRSANTFDSFHDDAFHQGNYRVGVYFTDEAVDMQRIASGKVNENRDSGHSLYVGQSHLFHFALDATGTNPNFDTVDQAVVAYFLNEKNQLVHSLTARTGTTRTAGSVLLPAGRYTVHVFPISLPGERKLIQDYGIRSAQVTDPLGVIPDDPTEDPFECPDGEGPYCYPGGIVTDDPFLWDDFVESLPDVPDLDLSELVESLFGDWWSWYWRLVGQNGPPFSKADAGMTTPGNSVTKTLQDGVLSNDIDPEDGPLTAILKTDVSFGILLLELDGGYTYTPNPGFIGTDQFQYVAFDLSNESNPSWVNILVASDTGITGDLNGDGQVDVVDVNLLSSGIHGTQDEIFDLNEDGEVEFADLEYLIRDVLDRDFGDTDLGGVFDSGDLIAVFQAGEYEDNVPKNSTWETGDWDGDGEFGTGDLVVAFQFGGYTEAAIAAKSSRGLNAAMVDSYWDDHERRKVGMRG